MSVRATRGNVSSISYCYTLKEYTRLMKSELETKPYTLKTIHGNLHMMVYYRIRLDWYHCSTLVFAFEKNDMLQATAL